MDNPSTKSDYLYTYIQSVGVVRYRSALSLALLPSLSHACPRGRSRHAGVRVGKYLHKIVPKLEQFCAVTDSSDDTKDSEVRVLFEAETDSRRSLFL